LNSRTARVEKYSEINLHGTSVHIKKLHFKMHSDTNSLCSVQPFLQRVSIACYADCRALY